MKRHTVILLVLCAALLPVLGCSDDDGPTGPDGLSVAEKLQRSLHYSTRGMEYFYQGAQGGFETAVGVAYEDLACKNCHVDPMDCTDCHASAEGGDTPADTKCTDACHGRQKAEVALGFTDVHRTAGFKCADCHDANDVHGDGTVHNSMLEPGVITAKCENCHPVESLESNPYHRTHGADMDCSACHTQTVVSCYSCHFESEISGAGKIAYGQFRNWRFLLRNAQGKIAAGNFQSLTHEGKAHVVFAPYYSHTVSRTAVSTCFDCHNNAIVQEYKSTGQIDLVSWDEVQKKLVYKTGIIPLPPDWETSVLFDFVTIDTLQSTPGNRVWRQMVPSETGKQMLFATPLSGMPD